MLSVIHIIMFQMSTVSRTTEAAQRRDQTEGKSRKEAQIFEEKA